MNIKNLLSKIKHKKIAVSLSALLLFILLLLIFSKPIYNAYSEDLNRTLSTDCFYTGISVNNVDLSGKSLEDARACIYENANATKNDINILVCCNERSVNLKADNFEYEKDKINEAIDYAYLIGREGSPFSRYLKIKALPFKRENIDAPLNFSDSSIRNAVEYSSSILDDKKIDAHVLTFSPQSNTVFTYEEGHDGMEIDKEELTQKIKEILERSHVGKIETERHLVKNTSSIEDVKKNTVLISEFSTISTNNSNGNNNMRLSMKFINGTVLNPGETFSFNEIVGDSNQPSRGFLPAASILNGKIVMSYGGGICQASTTVYGAAIRANMTILERHNHRYKSSYVPYGEDSAIDYGNLDLKFKNDLGMPVYISATMSGNNLNCKIYGPPSSTYDRIEVKSSVYSSSGHTNVKTQRVYYKDNVEVSSETLPSSSYK